jgi:hypothetical protein
MEGKVGKTEDYPITENGLIGETEQFRLYECELPGGEVGILKISVSATENGVLDREAYILQVLQEEADLAEKDYGRKNPGKVLNYRICFPNLVESFIAPDQGGRRVNILKFTHVGDALWRLAPITHLASRDYVRVDPRTSAWMLGKMLKLLVFTHSLGLENGQVTGENFLVERDQHYVALFDWSKATNHQDSGVPSKVASEEISRVATEVILALGGNPETGELPADEQLVDDRYARHIHNLAKGNVSDAYEAHTEFYKLIRALWPREFWPFTSYKLEERS